MSGVSAGSAGYGGLNMVIQQPSSFSDAPIIAKYLKDRQPVVVNLENVDKLTAQKIVDFLGGAVYALDGRLSKVANGIADDMLSTTLLATKAPILLAPAMNTGMWTAQATHL